MSSRVGRLTLVAVGVVAVVVGAVWVGQGLNMIPGSFMTGNRMWLVIGLVVAVAGIAAVSFGLRRPRSDPPAR